MIYTNITYIYSRFLVCYTLEKQNETMNEFLDGIEANGMIHQFKSIFERSRIKYVSIQIALKQSI